MKKFIKLFIFTFSFLSLTVLNIDSLSNDFFVVKPLPYSYNALKPYISEEIMKLHHDKHYRSYVTKLNKTISNYKPGHNMDVYELLKNIDSMPCDIALSVKNNGGGVYNHEFFFDLMTPNSKSKSPTKELKTAIEKSFGSVESFYDEFKSNSLQLFGSGWTWLVSDPDNNLYIINTPNQDSPITLNYRPIIGIDLWEHAYYLQYKTARNEYIDNWFKLINWDKALENYTKTYR